MCVYWQYSNNPKDYRNPCRPAVVSKLCASMCFRESTAMKGWNQGRARRVQYWTRLRSQSLKKDVSVSGVSYFCLFCIFFFYFVASAFRAWPNPRWNRMNCKLIPVIPRIVHNVAMRDATIFYSLIHLLRTISFSLVFRSKTTFWDPRRLLRILTAHYSTLILLNKICTNRGSYDFCTSLKTKLM